MAARTRCPSSRTREAISAKVASSPPRRCAVPVRSTRTVSNGVDSSLGSMEAVVPKAKATSATRPRALRMAFEVIPRTTRLARRARASATVCPARTPKRRAASLAAPSSFLTSSALRPLGRFCFDDRERQIFGIAEARRELAPADRAKRWRPRDERKLAMFTPKRGACRPLRAPGPRPHDPAGVAHAAELFFGDPNEQTFGAPVFELDAHGCGQRARASASASVKRNSVVCVFSTASARRRVTLAQDSIESMRRDAFGERLPGTPATSTAMTEKMPDRATRTATRARR